MKKLFMISAVCCSLQLFLGNTRDDGTCYAQGTWTKKANFGGTVRSQCVGFSIGNKGYIGTGYSVTGPSKDFWEWDQATNVWTQKADFGGTARSTSVGFSIGTKGYIGTGYDIVGFTKDFWEWDQSTNVWTQKADFGGTARIYAVGFSIGTNGYIGTGNETPDFSNTKDFWEWNQTTDTWTQKADYAGGVRTNAVGFSIGNKGYIGTGYDNSIGPTKDFWEWDPATDVWTQKADVGTDPRYDATGFSIGNKGYIGTGNTAPAYVFTQDFLEWDQATDTWTEKTDFAGNPRIFATGFSVGNKGYIGTGVDTGYLSCKDFWAYSPDTNITVACSVPTGENSTQTATTATLNWNVVPEALGYKVRYKIVGAALWQKQPAPTNTKKLKNLTRNANYVWQVRSNCALGNSAFSPEQTFFTDMKLSIEQSLSFEVFPDPFESSTTISFSLPEISRVQLELYDVAGRKMQTVLDGNIAAGNHLVTLNRNQLNAGLYFLQMRTNNPDEPGQIELITKKVMIIQ